MRRAWILAVLLSAACVPPGQVASTPDGAAVYGRCSGCHKATGTGVPGVFPPLAGHAARLENASRVYPIRVVLFGLRAPIRVEGKAYDGTMPAYAGELDDGEIAAVLNYVLSSWGNDKALANGFAKITPGEVKAVRAEKLTPGQVALGREKLKL